MFVLVYRTMFELFEGRALKEAEVLQALKDEVARSPLYAGGELEMIFSPVSGDR